jgi:hypothetical protein
LGAGRLLWTGWFSGSRRRTKTSVRAGERRRSPGAFLGLRRPLSTAVGTASPNPLPSQPRSSKREVFELLSRGRWEACSSGEAWRAPQPEPLEARGVDAGRESSGARARPPHALRHSFAAWSIRAGIGLFELARVMSTSVEHRPHVRPCSPVQSAAPERRWKRSRTVWTLRRLPMPESGQRKPPSVRGFPFIGAPRFELGTSSPPD